MLVVVVVALYLIGNLGSKHNNGTPKANQSAGVTDTHTSKTVSTTTASTTTTTTTAAPTSVTVKLVPTGPVWVCMQSGFGQKLIDGVTYATGETIPVETRQKLLLTLGNANVTMTVNGRPYTLTSSATAIGLRVTPTGVAKLTQGPQCA